MLLNFKGEAAVVHDWFSEDIKGGSEKVFQEIGNILSKENLNYDVYVLVNHLKNKNLNLLKNKEIYTSFIQNLPFSKKHFHKYFPLFPLAIEQFDLGKYNLIISSSHSFAKGVLTSPDQLHISYVHTPMRYAWDQMNVYLMNSSYKKFKINFILRIILQNLRQWDYISSSRIDKLIANSNFTSRRIKKYWGRDSKVLHPPVDTENFSPFKNRGMFYLSVSRLVPNKRVDILVNAFNALNLPLIIVGDGPEKKNLKKMAKNNIKFVGAMEDKEVKQLMEECRAFVYAGIEDFGIAPVEAMAAGAPVIAYGRAGILDTVNCITFNSNTPTGLIYKTQSYETLRDCINYFEEKKLWQNFSSKNINYWSHKFSKNNFRKKFICYLEEYLSEFKF